MFERLSDMSRRAIVMSQEEARLLGHARISLEHLLLSLCRDDVESAKFLADFGLAYEQVIEEIEKVNPPQKQNVEGHIPFAFDYTGVLLAASRMRDDSKEQFTSTNHLLLALLEQENENIDEIIGEIGVDRAALKQKLLEPPV